MSRDIRLGQLLTLISVAIEGLFPAIAHAATGLLPPLWFLAVCQLASCLAYAVIITFQGWRREIFTLETLKSAIGVAVCIVVVPYGLIFLGTRLSTGINTGLMITMEVPFTAVVSWLLFRESLTRWGVLGVGLTVAGALAIFGETTHGGIGEAMILLAVILLPFGNRFAKRAFLTLRGSELLCFRSFLAGVILLPVSAFVEEWPSFPLPPFALRWMALYVVILVVGKLFWYAGLKRLRLVDAVSMLAVAPAFSLVFTMLLLGERPTMLQLTGFILSLAGVALITNIRSAKTVV
ncbi:MAG: DMT family transporter [Candidatus Peribacteraceae bacterium]|nr:DMT family transporter [Candidatus Peribacteraceae bacterium]